MIEVMLAGTSLATMFALWLIYKLAHLVELLAAEVAKLKAVS